MQGAVREDTCRTGRSVEASIHETLAQRIGAQKHRIWFRNSAKLSLADGYLRVSVPNQFIAGWIENHFSDDLLDAIRSATGDEAQIMFSIDPQSAGHQRRSLQKPHAESVEEPRRPKARVAVADHRQERVDGRLKLTLDTFIVGPSNELAFNAARAVVNDKQSPFNPLFIHGGYGVGKTHLLQGICNEVRRGRPRANWLYLSAEDFANQFVLALKTKKLEAFRRRMRQTDLLAIDDIHFLASKPSTQEEFLHTFNTIDMAGKQVVLASDAHPKLIGELSDKLVNRFISGMVVKVEPPDYATRCEICRRYAAGINKSLAESVVEYIAQSLRSNVRELHGAILKLVAFSSLQNSRITLQMAQAVLAEHIERCDPVVHMADIEAAAARFFGTTPANIHSAKKDRTVALARHFCMYLARKHTRMSLAEIGRSMGGKNHATVLMGCKKIDEHVTTDSRLNWRGPMGNRTLQARTILSQLEKSIAG
jgi:chromosomal replication initiator protein